MVRNDLKCRGTRCAISKIKEDVGCACYVALQNGDTARRERRLAGEEGGDLGGLPMPPICLFIPRPDGGERLAGKLLDHATWGTIFYTSHSKSRRDVESGSPCPLDEQVLLWLWARGVTRICAYENDTDHLARTGTLRTIAVQVALAAPQRVTHDGCRRYPADAAWGATVGITTRHGGQHLTLFDGEAALLREVRTQRRITLDAALATAGR